MSGTYFPPSQPQGPLIVIPLSGDSVKLCWKSPLEDGGSAITLYIIEVIVFSRSDSHREWVDARNAEIDHNPGYTGLRFDERSVALASRCFFRRKIYVDSMFTEYIIRGIPPYELCMLRVSAENSVGIGEALLLERPFQLCLQHTRPGPPGKPEVIPDASLGIDPKKGSDVVNLKWTPPRYLGGFHLTGYLVERRELGSAGVGPGVWVRANAVLARAPRLAVASLEPGRRYQFRVSAENAAGLMSEPSLPSEPLAVGYQGGVATPPRFLTTLSDTTAVEDKRVDFVVDLTGTPAPSICWYKDSHEIFSTRRTRVATGSGRTSLTFHQVGLADEGEIRCTATNKAGHAVTKAMLRVEARPRIRLPRTLNTDIGSSHGSSIGEDGLLFQLDEVIRLRVGVTGRPQPEVTWYHNGEKLTSGVKDRVEITDSGKHSSLRILAAKRTDRGEYRVTAVNIHGQDTASFLVTVTDRPMPPSKVDVQLVQVGETGSKDNEEEDGREEAKPSSRYYLRVSWSPPDDDGGCRVGSYIIEYYRIGWNVWLKGSTCRQISLSLDNLIAGSEYRFRVKAENPYGVSDPSPVSNTIFLPDPKRGLMHPPQRGPEPADSEWLLEQERLQEGEERMEEEEQREKRKREYDEFRDSQRRRRLDFSPSPGLSPVPSPTWGGNTSPRSDFATDREGPYLSDDTDAGKKARNPKDSSNVGAEGTEFMLVLVPPKDSNKQQEENGYLDYRRQSSVSEGPRELLSMEDGEGDDEDVPMAPPMSLSAPVISGMEGDGTDYADAMTLPPLRNAVSSSELLHERAMARIYQDAADEEAAAALARRGSAGASLIRRGSSSSRRGSTKDKENWRELAEKIKAEEKGESIQEEGPVEEEVEEKEVGEEREEEEEREDEEEKDVVEETEEEEEKYYGRKQEESQNQLEEDEEYEEEEEGEMDEYDEEEEFRYIEERDRKRAEAIRRQELELTASEERGGGLSFGVGGRSGRMVTTHELPHPSNRFTSHVPSRAHVPSAMNTYRKPSPPRKTVHTPEDSGDVTYRKVPTTRPPVPALHISTIEDDVDDGKALDPTSVVIGHYGDIIREVSSRVRKASPTLFLSREELKAQVEEDFDPFEHAFLVGETEVERGLDVGDQKPMEPEEEEAVVEEKVEEELESNVTTSYVPEDIPVKHPDAEENAVHEVVDTPDVVPVSPPTPPPPRVLTPWEKSVEERVHLIIDSLTTTCLLGVASWLLWNGWDFTAAALVGLIAAKELYKAIMRKFPFLRRT